MIDPQLLIFIKNHGLDTVAGAFAYDSGDDLHKSGLGYRRRTRLEFRDEKGRCWELYLKRYGPLPLGRRIGRLLLGKGWQSEARLEFENIHQVRDAAVGTMREIVWGQEAGLLGVKRSYIIVTAVPGEAIERIGDDFLTRYCDQVSLVEELTDRLVELVLRLHQAGFVHRDLYSSHIFLHEHDGRVELNLIDLARIFQPGRRNIRWRVKDLGQLKYSMPWLWVEIYWEQFLKAYLQTNDSGEIEKWENAINLKVEEMQRRHHRRTQRTQREDKS